MASPGSFTRSAAQATSSAYRRLPIRWRLAGGSAVLTLVILLGFATIVGVLTTRRIQADFNREVARRGNDIARKIHPNVDRRRGRQHVRRSRSPSSPDLDTYATSRNEAVIRARVPSGDLLDQSGTRPTCRRRARRRRSSTATGSSRARSRSTSRRGLRPVRAQALRGARRPRTACASSSASA